MADGFEKFSEDEFSMHFTGLRIQARFHGLDMTDHKVNDFICHTAEVMAQMTANERQLRSVCHIPAAWDKILKKLEELGIQEEFKL